MPIRPKIKLFGYSTIVYGLANLLTKIVVITLVPLYTTYLTVFEVGLIVFLEMIELFVVTIIPIGCINAMWRYLPGEEVNTKNKIIISTFTIMFFSGLVLTILLMLFQNNISVIFNIPNNDNLLFFVFISCFLQSMSHFIYALLQYRNQAIFYLTLSLVQFLSLVGLTIYFIIYSDIGVIGIYYAKVLVFFTSLISVFFILIKTTPALPSFNLIKKILKYGLPMIPMILLMPVLNVSDRYFLKIFASLEDIGRYGIAYKFGMLINMFLVIPINRSWGPQMFQVGNSLENNREIHQDITFYYSFIGWFIIIGLSFFSDTIISIFANEDYLSAAWLIPWVSLAYFIGGFKIFLIATASLADRTDLLIKAGLFTIIFNIILNYFLIKNYGVEGAVLSTILSNVILIILLLNASSSINQFSWPIMKIIHGAIISGILIITFENIRGITIDYSFLTKCLLLIAFPILSVFTNLIGEKEMNGVRYLWSSILKKVKFNYE